MRRTVSIILASFCAFFLSCCDCCSPCTTVTYEVEGWASNASVEFNDDYEDRIYHSSVALPWVNRFSIKYRSNEYHGGARRGGYTAYIKAATNSPSGNVNIRIYVNGEVVSTKSTTPTEPVVEAFYAVYR